MKSGVELIAEERIRQIENECYSEQHDDEHKKGEMAISAASYALTDIRQDIAISLWPFGSCEFKPKSRIKNLIRAGALIAAEIDRLQRAGH